MGKLTVKQKLEYYFNKGNVDNLILQDASEDKHIIYGAKAINAQIPEVLQKHTDDFDIFSKTPKKDAFEMEKKLDSSFGGDFFEVKKGKYPGTWKVKSKVTGRTTADYTFPQSRVPRKKIAGNEYAKLSWIKKQIRRSLNKKENAFRFEKDNEALQRIKLYEKNKEFLLG